MSTPASRRITLLGGPNSGKSTYLGALVDALEAERLDALRLESLPDDTAPIRNLTDPLLEGQYPQRTNVGSATPLEVKLRTAPSPARALPAETFALEVADYSGEELTELFDARDGWSSAWEARASAQGLLLFIRDAALARLPQLRIRQTHSEQERWRALQQGSLPEPSSTPLPRMPEPPLERHSEAAPPPVLLPSDAVRVPTALSLIELLQFIRHARGLQPGQKPPPETFRIALLVSAWDSQPAEWQRRGPAEFIGAHLPLLEDFLRNNFHPLDVFRFGLSSTGGDLKDPRWRREYQDDPQGYVEWVDISGHIRRDADLALPLYWTLFGERAWKSQAHPPLAHPG